MKWTRTLAVGALLAGNAPRAVYAKPAVNACIAAHAEGQELRRDKQLERAREKFLVCATDSCPVLVRNDCAQFLAELEQSQPTIVLVALDESGRDLSDVRVELDGRSFVTALDGGARRIEPGEHRLRFVSTDGRTREYTIMAREGEKERRIVARFPARTPSSEERTPRAVPLASWILGGVGVAALGSFTYFGLRGRATQDCEGHCSDDEIDRLHAQYLAADISLGVSLVSLGLGTYLFLREPHESVPSRARAPVLRVGTLGRGGGLGMVAGGEF